MRRSAAPAAAAAVPAGSGRGRATRHLPNSPHGTQDRPGCRMAALPAPTLLHRGPGGSREAGHLWEGRSERTLGRRTHRNCGDKRTNKSAPIIAVISAFGRRMSVDV